jgi:hypothetical protein
MASAAVDVALQIDPSGPAQYGLGSSTLVGTIAAANPLWGASFT